MRFVLLMLCLLGAAAAPATGQRVLILGDLQCERTPAPLEALRPVAADVDLVLVNLEGPLTTRPFARLDKQWHLRSTPALATALARLAPHRVVGIVANNHGGDCGQAGVDDTRRAMAAAGLRTVGEAQWPPRDPRPLTLDVRGQRVALLAANLVPPTRDAARWSSEAWERRLVAQVRSLSAGARVVVCLHWNPTEAVLPTEAERSLGRRLIDAGAKVVAGFHPHVLGAIERRPRGLILYSVGNTALSCPCSQQPQGAAMRVDLDGDGRVIPLRCGRSAAGLRVALAGNAEARAILDWINTISVDFATLLDASGRIKARQEPATGPCLAGLTRRPHGARGGLIKPRHRRDRLRAGGRLSHARPGG